MQDPKVELAKIWPETIPLVQALFRKLYFALDIDSAALLNGDNNSAVNRLLGLALATKSNNYASKLAYELYGTALETWKQHSRTKLLLTSLEHPETFKLWHVRTRKMITRLKSVLKDIVMNENKLWRATVELLLTAENEAFVMNSLTEFAVVKTPVALSTMDRPTLVERDGSERLVLLNNASISRPHAHMMGEVRDELQAMRLTKKHSSNVLQAMQPNHVLGSVFVADMVDIAILWKTSPTELRSVLERDCKWGTH